MGAAGAFAANVLNFSVWAARTFRAVVDKLSMRAAVAANTMMFYLTVGAGHAFRAIVLKFTVEASPATNTVVLIFFMGAVGINMRAWAQFSRASRR